MDEDESVKKIINKKANEWWRRKTRLAWWIFLVVLGLCVYSALSSF